MFLTHMDGINIDISQTVWLAHRHCGIGIVRASMCGLVWIVVEQRENPLATSDGNMHMAVHLLMDAFAHQVILNVQV